MSPEINTFTELVKKNKIFVDNTLFIKELENYLSYRKTISIICPSKWGRSINLDMLKTFLQIPIDEHGNEILPRESTNAYRLFHNGEIVHDDGHVEKLERPLLIASDKNLMETHQGRFPVIFLSFSDVIGETQLEIKEKVRFAISRAFKQHQYMIEALKKKNQHDNAKLFKEYVDQDENALVNVSLRFLSEMLHDHFKTYTYLLIDDYDRPIHNFLLIDPYRPADEDKIGKYIERLAGGSFKFNEHVLHGVAISTFEITPHVHFGWANVISYVAQRNTPLREYFTFNYRVVQSLLEKLTIPAHIQQLVYKWYNGYLSVHSGERFFNPVSVANFVNEKKIAVYNTESDKIKDFIKKIVGMKQHGLREDLLLLISKQKISVDMLAVMTEYGVLSLHELTERSEEQRIVPCERHVFLSYLLGEGYLSSYDTNEIWSPNTEMTFILSNWLIDYYKQKYNINDTLLRNAAVALYNLIKSDNGTTPLLERSFTALVADCNPFIDKSHMFFMNVVAARSILNSVTLQMQRESKFQIDVFYNRSQNAEIVIIDNEIKLGIAIEFRYADSSAENAFNLSQSVESWIYENITTISTLKLVGINFCRNKTTQIITKTNEWTK